MNKPTASDEPSPPGGDWSARADAEGTRVAAKAREKQFREGAEAVLRFLEFRFQVTNNPLFVWQALKLFRMGTLPMPAWVQREFGTWIDAMAGLATKPPKERVDAAVGRALGFKVTKSGGNPFEQYRRLRHAEDYFSGYLHYRRQKFRQTPATEKVAADRNTSSSTVRRELLWLASQLGCDDLSKLEEKLREDALQSWVAMIGQKEVALRTANDRLQQLETRKLRRWTRLSSRAQGLK
jgi:hypothetical protein